MKMKNLSATFAIPAIIIAVNDKALLVPSMVLSTILTCSLITFIPQLMPLWMQLASNPSK
jgi:hypothetical protein